MTVNEALVLLLACMAGLMLGVVFFGGLCWTVHRGVLSEHPAPWFLGSWLLRMAVTVIGFYFVSGGHLNRLLICLLGFFVARLLLTHLTRPSPQKTTHAT